jgi:hypothetical protein
VGRGDRGSMDKRDNMAATAQSNGQNCATLPPSCSSVAGRRILLTITERSRPLLHQSCTAAADCPSYSRALGHFGVEEAEEATRVASGLGLKVGFRMRLFVVAIPCRPSFPVVSHSFRGLSITSQWPKAHDNGARWRGHTRTSR